MLLICTVEFVWPLFHNRMSKSQGGGELDFSLRFFTIYLARQPESEGAMTDERVSDTGLFARICVDCGAHSDGGEFVLQRGAWVHSLHALLVSADSHVSAGGRDSGGDFAPRCGAPALCAAPFGVGDVCFDVPLSFANRGLDRGGDLQGGGAMHGEVRELFWFRDDSVHGADGVLHDYYGNGGVLVWGRR